MMADRVLRDHPRLRIGGLMRCCIETWEEEIVGRIAPVETVIQCKYTDNLSHRMELVGDGVWEWVGVGASDG